MRTRLTVVALALALAGTLLYAAPASAVRSPFDLPRGADTAVPYLAGRTLHVGARTYTVPVQSEEGDYRVDYSLIGLDARGRWLIGVEGKTAGTAADYRSHAAQFVVRLRRGESWERTFP